MAVLVAGLRVLGVSTDNHGVLTDRVGTLSNDFFVNLMDIGTEWSDSATSEGVFEGKDRDDRRGQVDRYPQRSRVRFELDPAGDRRRLCRRRCRNDKFVADFAKAWAKVMDADRFDLA